jgi:hypothetical protein
MPTDVSSRGFQAWLAKDWAALKGILNEASVIDASETRKLSVHAAREVELCRVRSHDGADALMRRVVLMSMLRLGW